MGRYTLGSLSNVTRAHESQTVEDCPRTLPANRLEGNDDSCRSQSRMQTTNQAPPHLEVRKPNDRHLDQCTSQE